MPKTRVLAVDPTKPDPAGLAEAAQVLVAGGLVAFPTETVYGLGALALDSAAVNRIFAAKERPSTDPVIVHLAGPQDLPRVARSVPPGLEALATTFWPGPLTLIVPRGPAVPDIVTAGGDTVAVRVPAHPVARALLLAATVPIAAPSANRFSRPSPTRAEHVLADLDGRVDLILDAGPTSVGVESTIVDLTHRPARLLRPGGVPVEALREHLPDLRFRLPDGGLTLWVRMPHGSATQLAADMERQGIYLAPGPVFSVEGGADTWLRIPYAKPEEQLVQAVRAMAATWSVRPQDAGVQQRRTKRLIA